MSMDYEFDFVFSTPVQCGDGWLHAECAVDCCATFVGDDDGFDLDALLFRSHGGVGGAHRNKWMPVPNDHELFEDLKAYLDTPDMRALIGTKWADHRYNLKVEANINRMRGAA